MSGEGGRRRPGTAGGWPARISRTASGAARLVAAGVTDQRAALELFTPVRTVRCHLTHVHSGPGIRSRGELAARFREMPDATSP